MNFDKWMHKIAALVLLASVPSTYCLAGSVPPTQKGSSGYYYWGTVTKNGQAASSYTSVESVGSFGSLIEINNSLWVALQDAINKAASEAGSQANALANGIPNVDAAVTSSIGTVSGPLILDFQPSADPANIEVNLTGLGMSLTMNLDAKKYYLGVETDVDCDIAVGLANSTLTAAEYT